MKHWSSANNPILYKNLKVLQPLHISVHEKRQGIFRKSNINIQTFWSEVNFVSSDNVWELFHAIKGFGGNAVNPLQK